MKANTRRGLAAITVAVLLAAPGIAQAAPSTPGPTNGVVTSDTKATDYGVSVTTPSSEYGPVHLTLTGLKYGEMVRIKGAPEGWAAEYWYDRHAIQHGEGPLRVEIEGPLGWPEDHPFIWTVTFPNDVTRTTSFVYPGKNTTPAPTKKPTTQPTKKPTTQPTKKPTTEPTKKPTKQPENAGGLARTGV